MTVIETINRLLAKNHEGSQEDEISQLIFEHLPSGSGIDTKVKLDYINSKVDKKLIFYFSYHFMNDTGFYVGWEDYTVKAYPTFTYPGFRLVIVGKNKDNIKEYFYELFYDALMQQI